MAEVKMNVRLAFHAANVFDELKDAIEASPEPHVVKRFLEERFRIVDRLDELLRLEAHTADTRDVTLVFGKTDFYRQVVAAIRAGDLDSLLI